MDKKIEKRIWTPRRLIIIAVAVIALGTIGRCFYKNAGVSKLNVTTDRLTISTVEHNKFQEFIPVTGIVLPIKTVRMDAIEGGKVEEKFVEDGAIVEKGQEILRLSNPDLMVNYLNQEANIISQINQIRNTSLLMEQQSLSMKEQALQVDNQINTNGKRLRRNRKLYESNVISQVELEEMEDESGYLAARKKMLTATLRKDSAYQVLQQQQMTSSLDLMQRNLTITRQSVDQLIVKAPISGQLSGLTKELGESVARSENIGQIDDLTAFKIRVRIDEFYISRIALEQEGSFTLAGENYTLKITKIYPQVSNGAFEADMTFVGKSPNSIKRGQSISVKLQLSAEEDAVLLARGGFYQTTGGNWVYVLDEASGNAIKQTIRLGRQNPNFYEVLEGLKPGDKVITNSYDTYGDKDVLILK
ncbi:MAG: HlyD family efflux transporter periplasmic adaptor subunit [Saprospiraceae bacterium]|nr:HlyD family efflux transporter periplasmic adaptor subunit [Saprospiraceae bacterium]MCF8248561.1 HlyD family efflux transporter periplasmic adaptor subunit [Saprospiraceae bacterium]MCF8280272.1 HlyD family efflux transporter periplasmic adaptor subunit [Bacteroidales bacterium]MCF8310294.1 HlyD family efflux transporter periplasmic adaptor subunit [Saprospiraceae bacterium]MCF8439266.1 HlyD family efflux transporter periplasmic adaptor subunit [Saprospiraceae bacterium]